MSPEIVRLFVAIAVLGHGIGHILFMPLLSEAMRLQSSGHSWLLSVLAGDGATRLIASVVGGMLVAAFVIAAGGIAWQTAWWRGVLIGAAIASAVLVIVMWDGLLTGPASAALAFDAVIVVSLLVVHWPAGDLVGP